MNKTINKYLIFVTLISITLTICEMQQQVLQQTNL